MWGLKHWPQVSWTIALLTEPTKLTKRWLSPQRIPASRIACESVCVCDLLVSLHRSRDPQLQTAAIVSYVDKHWVAERDAYSHRCQAESMICSTYAFACVRVHVTPHICCLQELVLELMWSGMCCRRTKANMPFSTRFPWKSITVSSLTAGTEIPHQRFLANTICSYSCLQYSLPTTYPTLFPLTFNGPPLVASSCHI